MGKKVRARVEILEWFDMLAKDFREANLNQVGNKANGWQIVHWKKPNKWCFKANIDVAMRGKKVGLDVVIKDECERIVLTIVEARDSGYMIVLAAELQAILLVVEVVVKCGLCKVDVEIDSLRATSLIGKRLEFVLLWIACY